jgi:hypothetical protein
MNAGENEVTSFKLNMRDFNSRISGHLDTVVFIDGNAYMNSSSERKRIHPSTGWRADLLISRAKKRMILQPTSGRGRKRYLVFNFHRRRTTLLGKLFKSLRQAHLFLFLFTVCEATCFDLFTRSSSGLLTLRVKDAIYVLGSQHVYTDKIYDSVTSVMQVEVMYVYITVCS